LIEVELIRGTTFTMGTRRRLFAHSFMSATAESSYDVAPDGRFIMIRARTDGAMGEIVMIQNVGATIRPAQP
jgi:hypothetical protein